MRAVLENQLKELEKELPRSYASRRDFAKFNEFERQLFPEELRDVLYKGKQLKEVEIDSDFMLFKRYADHQISLAASDISREFTHLYGREIRSEIYVHRPEQLAYVSKKLSGDIGVDVRYFLDDGSSFVLGRDAFPGNPELDEVAEKRAFALLHTIERYGNREIYSRFIESLHLAHQSRAELEKVNGGSYIWKPHPGIEYAHQKRRSLKKLVAGGLMVASLLGAASVPLVKGDNQYPPIKTPYTKNPPAIDGVCKVDEWKDASVVKMVPYSRINDQNFLQNAKAYLMSKHDDNYLYGCIDWISQKDIRTKMTFQVIFDTKHDGIYAGNLAADDMDFAAAITNMQNTNSLKFQRFSFYGTNVDKFIATGSLSPSPNDLASTKNLEYEFAVSMEQLKMYPNPSDPNLIGFFAWATGYNYNNGIAYPIIFAKNAKSVPLSDMTFLPYIAPITTTTTTTSCTSKTSSKTTQQTTQTSQITSSNSQTGNGKINNNAYEIVGGIIAATVLGIIGFAYTQKKKKINVKKLVKYQYLYYV